MSDDVREVARAGIRQRHPDFTEDMVEQAAVRLFLGDELAERVFEVRS